MQVDPRLAEIVDCLYRLAVRALIFHEGKVLLVHEKVADRWSFPGGGIDYGEDISQALPRELAEELGVSATELKADCQIAYIITGAAVDGILRANLFYRVEIPMECIRASNDISGFDWFTPAEITPKTVSLYVDASTNDAINFAKVIETQAAR